MLEVIFQKTEMHLDSVYISKLLFTGFRRNKVWILNNQVLPKLEGINDKKESQYNLGKGLLYVYKSKSGFKTIKSLHSSFEICRPIFSYNVISINRM